jgi:hypothetical protein
MSHTVLGGCLSEGELGLVRAGRAPAGRLPHVTGCDACAGRLAAPPAGNRPPRFDDGLDALLDGLLNPLPAPLGDMFPDTHEWAGAVRAVFATSDGDISRHIALAPEPDPAASARIARAISTHGSSPPPADIETSRTLELIRGALHAQSPAARFISALAGNEEGAIPHGPTPILSGLGEITSRWERRGDIPCPVIDDDIERLWSDPGASLASAVRTWLGEAPSAHLERLALGGA